MKQVLFEVPIWKTDINPEELCLTSKDFKQSFDCQSISSFNGQNNLTLTGYNYLVRNIIGALSDEYKVRNVTQVEIWRNIYDNHFQDRHNHCGHQFAFLIYEKISKPQTVFFHPASDFMNASGAQKIMKQSHLIEPELNKIIIFPGYLDHMVRLSKDSQSISGNFNIELEGTNGT